MLEHAAIAALLVLVTSLVGLRWIAPGGRLPAGQSPGAAQKSPFPESRATRTSPGSRQGTAPALGRVYSQDADPIFRCMLNSHAHAVEFVDWMRAMGFAGRHASAAIMDYYAWWTLDARVYPLDEHIFLAALGALKVSVGKKRDRVKCPRTGKVLHLASGSPVRTYYYTIRDIDVVKVPSGVAGCSRMARGDSAARSRPRGARAEAHDPNPIIAGHERRAA